MGVTFDTISRTRSGTAARRRGLVLASLLLAGQVGTLAHLVAVRHVTCPEHGESIHAATPPAETATTAVAAVSHGPAVQSIALAAEHGHDHCLIVAERRSRSALLRASVAASPLPIAVAARPPVALAGRPALLAIYRLAPKNSPPA